MPPKKHIKSLMSLFEIAPGKPYRFGKCPGQSIQDFEESVLHESAVHSGAEYIVTRDISDFKKSTLPVFDPVEFIKNRQFKS